MNTVCHWRYQCSLILIIIYSIISLPTLHKVLVVVGLAQTGRYGREQSRILLLKIFIIIITVVISVYVLVYAFVVECNYGSVVRMCACEGQSQH